MPLMSERSFRVQFLSVYSKNCSKSEIVLLSVVAPQQHQRDARREGGRHLREAELLLGVLEAQAKVLGTIHVI